MSNQKPVPRLRSGLALSEVEVPIARNQNKTKGLIFVVSGPSGSGKTTLLKNLLKSKELKNRLAKSISFTTRPRRSGERQGKDYFFISDESFKQKLKAKKILEWTRYLGYYYATPKEFLKKQLAKNKNLILCLNLRGAFKIKRLYPQNTVMIFIQPPSLDQLQERIEKRCNKTKKEEIQKRLKLAKAELKQVSKYDYCLLNQDLADTVRQLQEVILKEIASRL